MTDQEKIIELEERLAVAVRNKNRCLLEKLLLNELAIIDRNGQVIVSTQQLETDHLHSLCTPNFEKFEKIINLIGNTAMVMLVEKSKGRYGHLPFEGSVRNMRIWKRIGDDWKVAAAS